MKKKIICSSCGAEFDESLPKCPYCDSMNYVGAEAEYLEKLDDLQDDLEDLQAVPIEQTKQEIRKQGQKLRRILLVIAVFIMGALALLIWSNSQSQIDAKGDYLWKTKNYPIMDEMYETGKYDELAAFYEQAYQEKKPIYQWEHSDFCEVYDSILFLKENEDLYDASADIGARDWYALALSYQLDVIGFSLQTGADEEEIAIISEYAKNIESNFQKQWQMTEEEYQTLYDELKENGGWVSLKSCDAFIDAWYAKQLEEK